MGDREKEKYANIFSQPLLGSLLIRYEAYFGVDFAYMYEQNLCMYVKFVSFVLSFGQYDCDIFLVASKGGFAVVFIIIYLWV